MATDQEDHSCPKSLLSNDSQKFVTSGEGLVARKGVEPQRGGVEEESDGHLAEDRTSQREHQSVRSVLGSVTRLGNLLDFGQLFKALGCN